MMIIFEIHHDELNHHRRYEIIKGRDLLAEMTGRFLFGVAAWGKQDRRDIMPRDTGGDETHLPGSIASPALGVETHRV